MYLARELNDTLSLLLTSNEARESKNEGLQEIEHRVMTGVTSANNQVYAI
jgi:hypothetical protein